MTPRPSGRHPSPRELLDYLDDRLAAAARREVETHLAGPCPACRAALLEIGGVLERMRTDRVPEVPAVLRTRALDAFAPAPSAAREPAPSRWSLARLLFDSAAAPLPAAVRRAVGQARGLRFSLGDHVLELEVEADDPGAVTVRGRLDAPDAAAHRIELAVGGERLVARCDGGGGFALDAVPAGAASIAVVGPAGRWRLPEIEL